MCPEMGWQAVVHALCSISQNQQHPRQIACSRFHASVDAAAGVSSLEEGGCNLWPSEPSYIQLQRVSPVQYISLNKDNHTSVFDRKLELNQVFLGAN